MSASGNGSPFPSPAASWIKNTSPAPTMPSRVRVLLKVPEVEAYCSVQPSTLRSSSEVLTSSTKSFWKTAPALPPPP